MSRYPLVSVVMSAYNAEEFIGEAIQSLLRQEYQHIELIVIDDGSTDATNAIVAAIPDYRIRLITHPENLRLARSLNEGVALANGTYIARLDADDLCHRTRLRRQVRFLERHPDVAVVGGGAIAIGDVRGRLTYPRSHGEIKARLLFGNALNHPTVMFRKSAIPEWYDESVVAGQDYELWSRLVWRVRLANLPGPAIRYRFHQGQSANRLGAHQREAARRAREGMARRVARGWTAGEWELHQRACEGIETLTGSELVSLAALYRELRERNRQERDFQAGALRRAAGAVLAQNVAVSLRAGAVRWRQVALSGLGWCLVREPRLAWWAAKGALPNRGWVAARAER